MNKSETQLEMFEVDYSTHDVDVTYEFSDNVTYSPEITLEEFDKFISASIMQGTDYSRDWVLYEETKPLVGVSFDEVESLKKDVANLTESLYKAYSRIKELSEEVAELRSQLSTFNIHKNTRKF